MSELSGKSVRIRDMVLSLVRRFGISSRYGPRIRKGVPEFHPGLDIKTPEGTPLDFGFPIRVYSMGTAGNVVIVREGDFEYRFYHLLPRQVGNVAFTGNTGLSDAPHLHFEVRHEGAPIDPELWLRWGELYPYRGLVMLGGLAIILYAFSKA